MIDKDRRRDLTVGLRHKDTGITYWARLQNGRDRREAKREIRDEIERPNHAAIRFLLCL